MEETVEKDTFKSVFSGVRKSLSFAWKKERKLLLYNIILSVLVAGITYVQLASFSKIVNEIVRIQQNNLDITSILITRSIILGLSFLIPSFLNNLLNKYGEALTVRMETHIQLMLINSFASLDIGTIQGSEFQNKLEKTSKWGVGSINNVIWYVNIIIRNIAGLVISGFILFFINPYLVLLALLGSISYYFVENKYGKELFSYWIGNDDSRIEADRVDHFKNQKKLIETILFHIKDFFLQQINKVANQNANKQIEVATKKSNATIVSDLLQTICLLIAIILVALATLRGQLLIGSLLLAFTTYQGFVSTTQSFFQSFSRLQEQTRFAKRWFDIFDMKSKILNKPYALKPAWESPPLIEFKNVSFIYPDSSVVVIKNLSFILESGEKLAIVGLNGAGKTTLVRLLCRIYDPTEGQILIDGIDLRDIDIEHWHTNLGVLFQDFTNYQMTVREAIAISRPDEPIDDEKVKWAAEMSGAQDFIEELPKKYEQLLWKGFHDGVELSKGQFQRMAVARILYRDALISILDEPTSAIDAVAEEKIFEVLETKLHGKTGVLISHRFSTVKNADKIAVIEHGTLQEMGSHKELMAKNGRYAELYNMQASRYLESEDIV